MRVASHCSHILLALVIGRCADAPGDLREFDTSIAAGNGAALKAMIDAGVGRRYIYLRPGIYTDREPSDDRSVEPALPPLRRPSAKRSSSRGIRPSPLFVVQQCAAYQHRGMQDLPGLHHANDHSCEGDHVHE